MRRVGPTEAERFQVITKLKAGASYAEATAELRKTVEPEWFDFNHEHLLEVAGVAPKAGEPKPKK